MKRRIWSIEELSHILLAANEANAATDALLSSGALDSASEAVVRAYREGFKSALGSIALAIGIPICAETPRPRSMQQDVITPLIKILPAD